MATMMNDTNFEIHFTNDEFLKIVNSNMVNWNVRYHYSDSEEQKFCRVVGIVPNTRHVVSIHFLYDDEPPLLSLSKIEERIEEIKASTDFNQSYPFMKKHDIDGNVLRRFMFYYMQELNHFKNEFSVVAQKLKLEYSLNKKDEPKKIHKI